MLIVAVCVHAMLSTIELSRRRMASDFAAGASGPCGVHAAWALSRPSLESESEPESASRQSHGDVDRPIIPWPHLAPGHASRYTTRLARAGGRIFSTTTSLRTAASLWRRRNTTPAAATAALVLRAAPKTAKDSLADNRPSSRRRPWNESKIPEHWADEPFRANSQHTAHRIQQLESAICIAEQSRAVMRTRIVLGGGRLFAQRALLRKAPAALAPTP